MDTNNSQATSPTFRIVTLLITLACLGASFLIITYALSMKEALIGVFGGYAIISLMMAGTSKFPSSAGMPVETPIGAPVQWRLVFMISAIFVLIFAAFIGIGEMFGR